MPTPPPSLELLLAHEPMVRGVAQAILKGDAAVDDVVQDTWVAALESGPRESRSIGGWLRGVARNRALNVLRERRRRRRREGRVACQAPAPDVEQIAERERARRILVALLLSEREPYRSALLLRYYEDLPPREIASRLGVPVETAKTRIKRGLARLRARMAQDQDQEQQRRLPGLLALARIGAAESVSSAVLVGGGVMGTKSIVLAAGAVLLGLLIIRSVMLEDRSAAPSAPSAFVQPPSQDERKSANDEPSLATTVAEATPARPTPTPGTVHAVVLDDAHTPVPGVQVLVVAHDPTAKTLLNGPEPDLDRTPPEARSDEQGHFVLEEQPRKGNRLLLVKEGYEIAAIDPAELRDATRPAPTLVLRKGIVLSGRVVSDDGEPIERARIAAMARTGREPAMVGYAVFSQADGSFRLRYLPANQIHLSANALGYEGTGRAVEADAAGEPVVLTLKRRALLVLVTDAETQRPIAQAGALLQTPDGTFRIGLDRIVARKNEPPTPPGWLILRFFSGDYAFPHEQGVLFVTAPGYLPEKVGLKRDKTRSPPILHVALRQGTGGAGFSGRVRGSKFRVRIEVRTPRPSTWADGGDATLPLLMEALSGPDGSFATRELPAGSYRLVFLSQDAASKSLDVVAPTTDLEVDLAAPGTVLVQVSPPCAVWVHLEQPGGKTHWTKQSDAEGKAAFTGMPSGRYRATITATKQPGRLWPTQWPYVPVRANFDLPGGQTRAVQLPVPEPQLSTIVVLDEDGSTRAGVRVSLTTSPGSYAEAVGGGSRMRSRGAGAGSKTGADGRISFDLYAGPYALVLEADGQRRQTWLHVKRGRTDKYTFTLSRQTRRMTGIVLDADSGAPISNRRIEVSIPDSKVYEVLGHGQTDERGRFEVIGIPAGPVQLNVIANLNGQRGVIQKNPYANARQRLDLSAGPVQDITIRLPTVSAWLEAAGRIEITVAATDTEGGKPLRGGSFSIEVLVGDVWITSGFGRLGEGGITAEPVPAPKGDRYRVRVSGAFQSDPPFAPTTVERTANEDKLHVEVALRRASSDG